VVGDEAQHVLAKALIRIHTHRRRKWSGIRPGIGCRGRQRGHVLHDAQEVVFLEHARERMLDSTVRTEEHDHRQSPDISAHEVRASVVVGEDVQVMPIQVVRYLSVRQDLLFEVLAPVTPDSADEQEDRFAIPLCGIERRRGMLHEPHLRRFVRMAPGVRGEQDSDCSASKDGEQPPP
jgi:hypothetical protein